MASHLLFKSENHSEAFCCASIIRVLLSIFCYYYFPLLDCYYLIFVDFPISSLHSRVLGLLTSGPVI